MSRTRLRLGAAALASGLALTLLAGAPSTAASGDPSDPTRLVVGTYNVHIKRSLSEFDRAVDLLKPRADVIGLQEIGRKRSRHLATDITWGVHAPERSFTNPVIWRRDVFDLLAVPTSRDVTFLARGRRVEKPGGGLERKPASYATVVRLRHRPTGTALSVVNVHLVNLATKRGRPHPNRPRRARLLRAQLNGVASVVDDERRRGFETFVTGDFNVDFRTDIRVRHRALAFRQLRRVGFRSMWQGTRLGRRGTLKRSFLDQIYADQPALSSSVERDIAVSDHYPALAAYRLPGAASGYQPGQGTFGFQDTSLSGWECHREWHHRLHQGPLRFRLTGDMAIGHVEVVVDTGGTAKEGEDFTVDASSLYDNDLGQNHVDVTLIGDTRTERDERFTLRLVDPFHAQITPSAATASGVIRNDDGDKWSDEAKLACTGRVW